jgi:hypothetical protein
MVYGLTGTEYKKEKTLILSQNYYLFLLSLPTTYAPRKATGIQAES